MASVAGAARRAPLGHLGAEVLTTADAAATIRRLRGQGEVLWAEPEQRRYRAQAASAAQTELSVPAAWATEPRMRGAGVEVAVIDDGVDPDNPDLSGSGKVVDGGDCSGESCLASGGTTPSGSHGTAVAALVAASEDAQGIVGGAPDATIVSYKVFADAEGSTTNTAVVNAMLAAAARPSVRVLNLSLSGQLSSRIERDALAVIRTSRPDLVVVAAAGNDGRELPNSPAGLDGVLSVGASGQGGDGQWRVASFSNRGDVDVLAPGVAVTSWWDGQLEALDGTSFAAPEVAAVAAGLVAVGVTGDRARAAIVASAEAPVTSDVVATASGSGRADALAAVTLATGSVPYVALATTGGSHVANVVGRRTVEQLRFEPEPAEPEGAVPLTATRGTVGTPVVSATAPVAAGATGATGLAAPGGVLTRASASFAVPAVNQGAVDATVAASVPDDDTRPLPLRLTVPTAGPEGTVATDDAAASTMLTYGTVSRYVRTRSLPAGAALILDLTTPPEDPACSAAPCWSGRPRPAAAPPGSTTRSVTAGSAPAGSATSPHGPAATHSGSSPSTRPARAATPFGPRGCPAPPPSPHSGPPSIRTATATGTASNCASVPTGGWPGARWTCSPPRPGGDCGPGGSGRSPPAASARSASTGARPAGPSCRPGATASRSPWSPPRGCGPPASANASRSPGSGWWHGPASGSSAPPAAATAASSATAPDAPPGCRLRLAQEHRLLQQLVLPLLLGGEPVGRRRQLPSHPPAGGGEVRPGAGRGLRPRGGARLPRLRRSVLRDRRRFVLRPRGAASRLRPDLLPAPGPGWLLGAGRTLHWDALTANTNWYQVKNFTVRWRYYVLR